MNSTDHFLSLPLRHNSLTRIDNRPVYYKSWSCKGIQNVTDLFKDPNTFLSSHELKERYNVKANRLSSSSWSKIFFKISQRKPVT